MVCAKAQGRASSLSLPACIAVRTLRPRVIRPTGPSLRDVQVTSETSSAQHRMQHSGNTCMESRATCTTGALSELAPVPLECVGGIITHVRILVKPLATDVCNRE